MTKNYRRTMKRNTRGGVSKEKALQTVVSNLRTICYEQTVEHRTSISQIAGLVGLCELALIIFIIVLSLSGWSLYGMIIASMITGSFVTNMAWFVLARREVRVGRSG